MNAANPETVRIAPALTIGDAELDEFRELFAASLADVQTSLTESGKALA